MLDCEALLAQALKPLFLSLFHACKGVDGFALRQIQDPYGP